MVTRRIAGTTMANPIILVATIAWRSLVSLGLWIPKKESDWIHCLTIILF